MKNVAVLAVCLFLQACTSASRAPSFQDPISGQTNEMLVTELTGWQAHQFKAAPDGMITLATGQKPVVSVWRAKAGQDVSVHGRGSEVLATVRTEGNGAELREIEFIANGTLHRVHRQGGAWVLSTHDR